MVWPFLISLAFYLYISLFFRGAAYPSTSSGLDPSNKGHQLLQKMGWSAGGLGASGQGIAEPISGGIVRDKQDQYKGKNILFFGQINFPSVVLHTVYVGHDYLHHKSFNIELSVS